jgi:hypothetical protein
MNIYIVVEPEKYVINVGIPLHKFSVIAVVIIIIIIIIIIFIILNGLASYLTLYE